MAGFLDKNNRVVDMILTMEGRRLLALGQLQFVYFVPFDDEVDYDPYISQSGTMTAIQLSGTRQDMIEASLVREAVSGYRLGMNRSGSDFTNVRWPIFTQKQGAQYLMRLTGSDVPTGSVNLEVRQQKHQEIMVKVDRNGNVVQQLGPFDRGYDRFASQDVKMNFTLVPSDIAPDRQHQEGILVRVFRTGSEGLVEVQERRDSNNDLTFNNDFQVHLDQVPRIKKGGS